MRVNQSINTRRHPRSKKKTGRSIVSRGGWSRSRRLQPNKQLRQTWKARSKSSTSSDAAAIVQPGSTCAWVMMRSRGCAREVAGCVDSCLGSRHGAHDETKTIAETTKRRSKSPSDSWHELNGSQISHRFHAHLAPQTGRSILHVVAAAAAAAGAEAAPPARPLRPRAAGRPGVAAAASRRRCRQRGRRRGAHQPADTLRRAGQAPAERCGGEGRCQGRARRGDLGQGGRPAGGALVRRRRRGRRGRAGGLRDLPLP